MTNAPLTDEQLAAIRARHARTSASGEWRTIAQGATIADVGTLLAELDRLRALVADMHAAATGSTLVLLGHVADMHGVRDALNAQLHRADTLNRFAREHRTEAEQPGALRTIDIGTVEVHMRPGHVITGGHWVDAPARETYEAKAMREAQAEVERLRAELAVAQRGLSAVQAEVAEIARTADQPILGDQARKTAMRVLTAMRVATAAPAPSADAR